MAAVVALDTLARPRPVALDRARPPRCHRSAAVYRRRRFAAAAVGLALVFAVAHAGAALGGTDIGPVERPEVVTVTVQPGDTLWTIARRLAPDADPREVVDALVEARGTTVVVPGETLTWLDR